jgi:hypothetical protein
MPTVGISTKDSVFMDVSLIEVYPDGVIKSAGD